LCAWQQAPDDGATLRFDDNNEAVMIATKDANTEGKGGQAAAGGNADAQHALGQLLESGEMTGAGLLPDLGRAFLLHKCEPLLGPRV
jgi:TPR repeat protein